MHTTESIHHERRLKNAVQRAENDLAHWKAHYERCKERGYSVAVLERLAQIVVEHREALVAAEARLHEWVTS